MKKQPGYSIFLLLTIISAAAALWTLVPQDSASKACLLGYKAHCSFAPVSTLICIVLAGVSCRIRSKRFKG
jgi:hypothetical protein